MTKRTFCSFLSVALFSGALAGTPACSAGDIGSTGGTQALRISEVMYHPVDENAPVENHEYVELFNRGSADADLSNWRLSGDIQYTFAPGTTLPAGGYLVIAKNRTALLTVSSYQVNPSIVLGDYAGELSNGGGTVTLQSENGVTADSLTYNDGFPWPIGADALGADDEWLGLLPTPITKAMYQYRGRSLERVSYDVPSDEISNWVPSPLDGPSPGRANSLSGAPPTIVNGKLTRWSGSDPLIRSTDTVKLSFTFSTLGSFSNPQLEYFVDDMQVTGEPTTTVPLTLVDGSYEASLPAQPDNSIVRYRVRADLGAGSTVLSPRLSDPFQWWAYFVTPALNTTAPVYQVFINKAQWNTMWDNISAAGVTSPGPDDRRVAPGGSAINRCLLRDTWDATVPATFVYNGVVYDTFVRYQGSRWNRVNGIGLTAGKTTISPLPDRPTNPTVFSWKLDFPAYGLFENKRAKVVLNKLNQACPGLDDALGERIYGDPSINIPVQRLRYTRFHVNGGYYHYMMDIEHIDSDMMKRYLAPGELMGDLFKSDGNAFTSTVEGPYGVGDDKPLTTSTACPMWTLDQRYEYTYQRSTNKWERPDLLRGWIEQLWNLRTQAMASGDYSAVRAFIQTTFDYQELLDYIAIRNWSQTWDDVVHNHFFYRRASDGKWIIIPQDKDLEFGEFWSWYPGKSFFIGEENNLDNRLGWTGLKDAFIKAFRPELIARVQQLSTSGVLAPASYTAKVNDAAAQFSLTDYQASPAAGNGGFCDFNTELANLRNFGPCRDKDLTDGIDPASCPATSCGLKGEYYQTNTSDTTRAFTSAMLKTTRTDPRIMFDFGTAAPAGGVPADNFQIRWSGRVVPRATEAVTFYTQTDDGVRLYINGALVIDRWMIQNTTEYSATVNLTAGVPVTITMEYFDGTGGATARLLWSSPSMCKQYIPYSRLRPM